ncbi:MAG: NAD(P)H-dependent oxidoreductase [Paracoccaceae bacterium]
MAPLETTGTLAPAVRREIDRSEQSDLVVLQFPLWWHAPLVMLEGWFDGVSVDGGLCASRRRYGRLRGRRAFCSVTTGAPAAALAPVRAAASTPSSTRWTIRFTTVDFAVHPALVADGVRDTGYVFRDESALRQHLDGRERAWSGHLRRHRETAPLAYPGSAGRDEDGRPLGGPPACDPAETGTSDTAR